MTTLARLLKAMEDNGMAGADFKYCRIPEILRHFNYEHLPPDLQEISQPFYKIADNMISILPDTEQRAMLLQHLLIAKDAAVRAALDGKG